MHLYLQSLALTNFKNISSLPAMEFSPKINCFLGPNGMGKSNLLDAVYMLSFTKSFTAVPDALVIARGEEFATMRALYRRHESDEEVTLGLVRGRRKSLKRCGKEYQRLSAHIGVYPLVLAAPHDIDLIRGSGEERRRWMDMVISQSDGRYMDALIRYNASLEQRNRLLRDGASDRALFMAVEMGMAMAADIITSSRRSWTARLAQLSNDFYREIAGEEAEQVNMEYENSLTDGASLTDLFDKYRTRDEALRHTTVGPHRDDIVFSLSTLPMRRSASQGQCKTLAVALRLAQAEFLHRATGLKPLLLLDDVFDRLDAGRVERIMELVTSDAFGQIFITDTNREHLNAIISRVAPGEHRMWSVADGCFTPISTEQ